MNKYKSLVTGSLIAVMIIGTPIITFAEKNNKDDDNENRVKVEQTSTVKGKNGFLNFDFKGNSESNNSIFHRFENWFSNKKEILEKRKEDRKEDREDKKEALKEEYENRKEDRGENYENRKENLAPSIEGITAPTVLKVNEVGTWTVKASDPKNGSLSYAVDFGDTNLVAKSLSVLSNQVFVQTGTFTHAYAVKGTYKVKFTVSNEAGIKTVSTVTVHIVGEPADATAPVIKSVAGLKNIKVGETETVTINAYDPNNKTLSYSADWGDGVLISNNALVSSKINPIFVQTATLSHVYSAVGTYTATFTVENSDGKKDSVSKKIIVTPVVATDTTAPIISNVGISTGISNNVIISWKTNEKTTSEIFYGASSGLDVNNTNTLRVSDAVLKTNHSLSIPSLTSSTLYHFILKSADASNNVTISSEAAFRTN